MVLEYNALILKPYKYISSYLVKSGTKLTKGGVSKSKKSREDNGLCSFVLDKVEKPKTGYNLGSRFQFTCTFSMGSI